MTAVATKPALSDPDRIIGQAPFDVTPPDRDTARSSDDVLEVVSMGLRIPYFVDDNGELHQILLSDETPDILLDESRNSL